MVRIRLRRVGRRHKPIYRVVVAESTSPRDGDFIEILGHYNPLTEPPTINIDESRALEWLKQGAKPSETVQRLLTKTGISQKATPQA
ncbi:MAG: 30S ribosomal protein S16 [Chloroflexota bacterium]